MQGIIDYGLWYTISKGFKLKAYTNVYWAGSTDGKKRTSSATFFLGNCLLSLVNKKQDSISFPT